MSKTYTFVERKGLNKFVIIDRFTIRCLGGVNNKMSDELIFLDSPKEIPKSKGKTGRAWEELFDKIPNEKVLVLDEETYGSAPNIRSQVKDYNEKNGEVLTVTQRTVNDKTTVYITRNNDK